MPRDHAFSSARHPARPRESGLRADLGRLRRLLAGEIAPGRGPADRLSLARLQTDLIARRLDGGTYPPGPRDGDS